MQQPDDRLLWVISGIYGELVDGVGLHRWVAAWRDDRRLRRHGGREKSRDANRKSMPHALADSG